MSDTIYPNVSEVSISLASAMTLVKSVLTTAIFVPIDNRRDIKSKEKMVAITLDLRGTKYQCILFITKYLGDD